MPPRKRKDPQPSLEAVLDKPVTTKSTRKGKLDKPIIEVRGVWRKQQEQWASTFCQQ